MSVRNWRQSEICIVINDKSHDSTAKHLSCDEFDDIIKFIIQFAGERIFKICKHFGDVRGKMVDCVISPIRLRLLSSKMQNLPDKQNNLCITDGNSCKLLLC